MVVLSVARGGDGGRGTGDGGDGGACLVAYKESGRDRSRETGPR